MATNFLWGTIGSATNLLTTELNSLASGSGTAYGPEINNTVGTSGVQVGTLWFHIASNSLAFTSGSYVTIYFVPSTTPGTASGTYPTYTSGASPTYSGNGLVCNININPKTQSANVVDETLSGIILPAGYFKTILINNTGVALPASGNTLEFYPTPTQY